MLGIPDEDLEGIDDERRTIDEEVAWLKQIRNEALVFSKKRLAKNTER